MLVTGATGATYAPPEIATVAFPLRPEAAAAPGAVVSPAPVGN